MRVIIFKKNFWVDTEVIFDALNEELIRSVNSHPVGSSWDCGNFFRIEDDEKSAFCWNIVGFTDCFAKDCVARTLATHFPDATDHYVSPEFISSETQSMDRSFDIHIQALAVFRRYGWQGDCI